MYKILSICKGGGYMYCKTDPKHPKANSNGLYPLHRVLAENKLGRNLLPNEDVHHIDEDKTNNSIDNLEVLSRSEHVKRHRLVIEDLKINCVCCGNDFYIKPRFYRLQKNRNKRNEVYCSRRCGAIMSHVNKRK